MLKHFCVCPTALVGHSKRPAIAKRRFHVQISTRPGSNDQNLRIAWHMVFRCSRLACSGTPKHPLSFHSVLLTPRAKTNLALQGIRTLGQPLCLHCFQLCVANSPLIFSVALQALCAVASGKRMPKQRMVQTRNAAMSSKTRIAPLQQTHVFFSGAGCFATLNALVSALPWDANIS